MRRIVGNLDFETTLAGAGATPTPLAPAVLETISSFGTLLRVLAEDGDRLWLPAPVDPARVLDVPGLPRPLLESGPAGELEPAAALLAWGETMQTASWRGASRGTQTGSPAARPAGPEAPPALACRLWSAAPASPRAAAAVNHRAFCLELRKRLDQQATLPGASMLESIAALEHHLQAGAAAASRGEHWVLKAPLSAAGRERLRSSGRELGTGAVRNRALRLFQRHGPLLFEPWMERVTDFGCAAFLDDEACHVVGFHRQEVDGYGCLRGLELLSRPLELPTLTPPERITVLNVVSDVGQALRDAGYRGPFGVDGWRYRDADGELRLNPLGEINARMSFGLVARLLVDRLTTARAISVDGRFLLRFGDRRTLRRPASRAGVDLIAPTSRTGGAWLEIL